MRFDEPAELHETGKNRLWVRALSQRRLRSAWRGSGSGLRGRGIDFCDQPTGSGLSRRQKITDLAVMIVDRSSSSSWTSRASRCCRGHLQGRHPLGMRRQGLGWPLERPQRAHQSGKGSGREGMGWEWEGRAAAGGAGALLPLLSACRTCGSCGLSARFRFSDLLEC